MTPEKQEELLINLNANVEILLERHTVREKVCDIRLRMIDDLNDRVDVVEDFIEYEKTYRRVVIGLLIGLGGLISWGMNLIPKAITLFSSIPTGGS